MHLIIKNKVYRHLLLSRILDNLGASLYNIVFVVYAATCFKSQIIVSIANITMMIPTLFSLLVGIRADKTKQKGRWLITCGFVQASLFTLVGFIINKPSLLVFAIVCLVNIISDCLSDYANGLRLPILQKQVAKEDLVSAYASSQFAIYVCNLLGQTLGIWLLTIANQQFAFIAFINALSFILASLVLLPIRQDLTYQHTALKEEISSSSKRGKDLFLQVKTIFQEQESVHFIPLLLSIMLINMLACAMTSIYNIILLKKPLLGLSYSQGVLMVEVAMIGGLLVGSLSTRDYFAKRSLKTLVSLAGVMLLLTGLSQLFSLPAIFSLLFLFITCFLSGKVNPKLNALLLSQLPSQVLARVSSFLTLLFTLSAPLGVVIFSFITPFSEKLTWLLFTGLAFLSVFFTTQKKLS